MTYTAEERDLKRKVFCKQWQRDIDEKKALVIWAQFGKDKLRQDLINEPEKVKDPDRLYQTAVKNFLLQGHNKVCTRCDGKGTYSYNPRSGRTCFKCSGRKWQPVIPSKRDLLKLIEQYPGGIVFDNPDYTGGTGKVLKKEANPAG